MSKTGNDFTKLPPRSPNKYSSKLAASAQRVVGQGIPQGAFHDRRLTEKKPDESESEYYDEEEDESTTTNNLQNINNVWPLSAHFISLNTYLLTLPPNSSILTFFSKVVFRA